VISLLLAAQLLAAQPRDPVQQAPVWSSDGPDGGSVPVLAASADGVDLYAGTLEGLFKSDDGGLTWRRLDSFPRYGLTSVIFAAVAPSDPLVVYAAASTATLHFHHIALYRSEDAGTTWTFANISIDDDFFTKFDVAIDPNAALTIFVSLNGSSLKSADGGETWTSIPLTVTGASIASIAIDPTNPSTLYGNSFVEDEPGHSVNQLQKSVDAGATWGSTGLVTQSEFTLVDPENPRILFAPGLPFARSDDGGLTISKQTTSPGVVYSLAFGGGAPRRLYAIVGSGASAAVYASPDRGTSWSLAGAPLRGISSFVVEAGAGDEDRIFAGAPAAGVFLSNDGGAHWEPRSQGLREADIGAVAVFPSDGRIAYALGPGFAKTSDGGKTWSVDPFAPVASYGGLAADPSDPNVVYAADATAGIRKSVDGGATWSEPSPTGQFVNSIAIDPVHPSIVYAADGRALKSVDGGITWQVIGAGIPDGVKQIVVDPSDSSVLYAISGPLYAFAGTLSRSIDAGATWTQPLQDFVDSIAPEPGHLGTVYAGSSSFFYRSIDDGATWSKTDPVLGSELISLVCDANGVLYAAARSTQPYYLGVTTPLRSDDAGVSWRPIGEWHDNILAFPYFIHALAVDLSGRYLYAGTEQGVWQAATRRPRPVARL
jgi:photosystem II stability/assembly factor-like uncharacterized protein